MLPVGSLTPAPGWGPPRESRLTHPEQRTLLTLWSILRSPLFIGGNLTRLDAWTTALLTNPEVIALDQHGTENHPVLTRPDTVVWTARVRDVGGAERTVLAVFNLNNEAATLHLSWAELGLQAAGYTRHDLWTHTDDAAPQVDLTVSLEPHGCALLRVDPGR